MSKQVRVRYTFTVEQTVTITDETPPAFYDQGEWEQQQVQDAGDKLARVMEGRPSMAYQIIG